MKTTRVGSWGELQDRLFEDSWNPELGRFRSRYAFRGLSDARYRLETTLIRLRGKYVDLERHLLRNFSKYARRSVVERDSIWHWISVAQHYGLPTRVLDWTYSPFVAMHFATANIEKIHLDGVIWGVNYPRAHALLPAKLKVQLAEEGADIFTVEMLAKSVCSLRELAELCPETFVVFFEPPLHRRPHRQPIRFFFGHVRPQCGIGRLAAHPPRPVAQNHHSRRAQMGDPGQARPGEHHRTGVVPRPRRAQQLAETAVQRQGLRARTKITQHFRRRCILPDCVAKSRNMPDIPAFSRLASRASQYLKRRTYFCANPKGLVSLLFYVQEFAAVILQCDVETGAAGLQGPADLA